MKPIGNVIADREQKNIKAIGEKLGFEPYKVKENAWQKNGISITSYTSILSNERFNELYKINQKKR